MTPLDIKKYFTFWSINKNVYLLKKIRIYYLFLIPFLGFFSFLVFFTLRVKKISQFLFSSKKYTYKYFWKNLYYCLLFPTILLIFCFMFPYVFIYKSFEVNNLILLYCLVGISLFSYYIGHLVFVISIVKNFNLRIIGLKNEYFYLHKDKSCKFNYEKVLTNNKKYLLNDIEEKKIFLERFYEKDVPLERKATIVSKQNISNTTKSNKKNASETNYYVLNNFYKSVKHLLEYDEENANKNFYLEFYKKTKEFNNYFETFNSVLGTNIFMKEIDKFCFKKYLYLFVYFIFFEILLFLPIYLSFIVPDYIDNKSNQALYLVFSNIGIFIFDWLVLGFIWKFYLKSYLKYLDMYALKSAVDKLNLVFKLDLDTVESNPLVVCNQDFSFQTDSFLENSKKIEEDEKESINFFEYLLTNQKNISNKLKLFNNFFKFSYIYVFVVVLSYFVFLILYILNYFLSVMELPFKIYTYYFLFIILLISIVCFVIYLCTIKLKAKIDKINVKYNQKFLLPYLTSHYNLPSLLFLVISKYSKKILNFGDDTKQYLFVNFWNFDNKRGTSEFSEKTSGFFFNELLRAKSYINENGISLFYNNADFDLIYEKKLDLLNRVLDLKNEYVV